VSLRRALLLALLLAPASCGEDEPPPPSAEGRYDGTGRLVEGARRVTASPNVILICIDTMRADAIESRGGEPPPCPNLARYAEQCVRFSNAASSAAWTAPSVTTVLTGLLPSRHGVEGCMSAGPLLPAVASLAEYLKGVGYVTDAMTGGGWVSPDLGHLQGFDRFSWNWSFLDDKGALARWGRTRDRSKPFFLFLHTYDAHDPYGRKRPPEGEDDPARVAEAQRLVERMKAYDVDRMNEITDEDARDVLFAWRADPFAHRTLERAFRDGRFQGAVLRYDVVTFPKAPDRDAIAARLRARYDAGLRHTDELFAGVLRRLDEAEVPVNTVTVLVSDHGEAFGEHRNLGHGRWLYDELTRVAFLVRAPGRFPARDVAASVGLVDVAPTILDVCGLPHPHGIDGRSLVPLLEGKETGAGRPVRAEDHRFAFEGPHRIGMRTASVRTARAKWIVNWDPRTGIVGEEVYDLAADPGEQSPLPADAVGRFGADFEAEVARARAVAKAWKSRDAKRDVQPPEDH
jgi:arylsulfatase A-like enzyme